jgi:membrane-bound metal-dependent hydrolase YbcI (DUF457 family)
MDILTHAAMGLIAAGPFLADRPQLALGVVAGSVLPDLDAFCRLVGKRAFLKAHQTWSHALPVQLALSFAIGSVAVLCGWNGVEIGGGLLAGLLGHSLLDLTNTFGVAWLLPFSRHRFCLEWVFFIDAVILTGTAATLALVIPIWLRLGQLPALDAAAFLASLCAYVLCKAALRSRAERLCPGAKSLVPSALVPWRFYGTERQQNTISFFRVNALTGDRSPAGEVPLLDATFAGALQNLPEFRLMREVSAEYHVVGATAFGPVTRLLCRDMRTRNLGSRFGDLEVWLGANRQITRTKFHV